MFLILAMMAVVFNLMGLERRDSVQPLKVSILVPCHAAHFRYLENLLECYAHQTVIPDEVVISLSEYHKLRSKSIADLEKRPWPFALKILKHARKITSGGNRTYAAKNSTGDLLLGQDADDIPHPQRVEVIKYLFETFKIDHLLHRFHNSMYGAAFDPYSLEELEQKCVICHTFEMCPVVLLNGTAFLRPLIEKIQWEPLPGLGDDEIFNREAYKICENKVIFDASLMDYRVWNSTYYIENGEWRSKTFERESN